MSTANPTAFPAASGLAPLLRRNLHGQGAGGEQFEIDAVLTYVTDVVLSEVKAAWGREAELSPERSEGLLNLLRQRFSVTVDGAKGVGQLARVAAAVAAGRWRGAGKEIAAVRRIFRVLVVHDRLYGSPGFGAFVMEEFRKALGSVDAGSPGEITFHGVRIVAPIGLTAEDVELLEVSSERTGLRDLFGEYSRWSPDRMSPFSAYLAEISASGRVLANRALAGTSMGVLTRAIERLFPDAAHGNVDLAGQRIVPNGWADREP